MSSLRFADLMNRDDIWMIQRRDRARFLAEPAQSIFICDEVIGQQFEGHAAAQSRIMGQVDFSHSTAAEKFEDLVWTKRLARQRACLMGGEQFGCNFQSRRANKLASLLVRGKERFHFPKQRRITSTNLSEESRTICWCKLKRRVIHLADLLVTLRSHMRIDM